MRDLIRQTAVGFGLDPDLVEAIVAQESGGDTWACRYEPGFYRQYVQPMGSAFRPAKPRGVSNDTEARLRACSFGLMQVMGQVAREQGLGEKFLTALCDPEIGLNAGCRHLADKLRRYNGHVPSALAAYNAGTARRMLPGGPFANQRYVDEVLARLEAIRGRA